jgi:predicted TPR repeat methyltransferase
MRNQQDENLRAKEESLRSFLAEKPKNAKAMARLSSLLVDRSKVENNVNDTGTLREEAITLARRAIQIAPKNPFGYAALSIASLDFSVRMESLQQAADRSTQQQTHCIPRVGFLVRLLVEPREQEARKVQGKIGKAAQEHPNRRDLDETENRSYKELTQALDKAWAIENLSVGQKEFISSNEYQLGRFFRKKNPPHKHHPRAIQHFQKSLEQHTSNSELARFWLATIVGESGGGNNTPCIDKCPAEYVVGLYSTFAARFDELLVEKLNYQTPTKLRKILNSVLVACPTTTKLAQGLDLGCGTGLSGLAFVDIVDHLMGVDLSPEMIEKAEKRNCYEKLVVGDVTSVFNDPTGVLCTYDLVLACDVFCYIGDLSAVFAAVSSSLSQAGFFCFSTEHLEEKVEEESANYRLHACARFAHKKSYLEQLAEKNGFEIVKLEKASIRKNQGKDVQGILAVFRLLPTS